MNEPKRWLNDGASPVMQRLLQAAGSEQPPTGSLERALASVAVASGTTGVAAGAGAVSSSGVFLKWTLLACTVTVGAAGVGFTLSREKPDNSGQSPAAPHATASARLGSFEPRPATTTKQQLPTTPLGSAARLPLRAERHRDVALVRPVPSSDDVIEDIDSLSQETQLIEAARAHRAARRAAAALAALDEYERRFTAPRYAPEALYLRMEALLALGQYEAARQVANRLATSYPNSPHAVRAESVRASKNP